MKRNKKTLLLSGITAAIIGIVAAGYLVIQLLPSHSLAAFAETLDSHQEKDTIGVYASGATAQAEKQADTKAPVITEKDATVNQGAKVNILENVTAKDEVDGDLTSKIKTEGTVDTSKPGTYTVKLAVTDDSGNSATAAKKVTVKAVEKKVAADYTAASSSTTAQSDSGSTSASSNAAESSSAAPAASSSASSSAPAQSNAGSATKTASAGYAANTMYIAGSAIPYQNGGQGSGQSIIDSNPGVISTWGGAATQSGSDGMNTHFIGHNPGIFSVLFSVGSGSSIVVTDGNGTPTTYRVSSVFNVNDAGVSSDGANNWTLITGTGGGERITLQTCVNDSTNRIVIAYK